MTWVWSHRHSICISQQPISLSEHFLALVTFSQLSLGLRYRFFPLFLSPLSWEKWECFAFDSWQPKERKLLKQSTPPINLLLLSRMVLNIVCYQHLQAEDEICSMSPREIAALKALITLIYWVFNWYHTAVHRAAHTEVHANQGTRSWSWRRWSGYITFPWEW